MSDQPTANHPVSSWVWYIAGLPDFEAMQAEMQKCPEHLRKEVAARVNKLILESNKARRG